MKKKFFVLPILFLMNFQMSYALFFNQYRHDNKIIYKLFGYSWGWNGNERLSQKEVEFLIEKLEADVQTEDGRKIKKESNNKVGKENALSGRVDKQVFSLIDTPYYADPEIYFQHEMPDFMIIRQIISYFWGMYKSVQYVCYPVIWHDDECMAQSISITNQTGELLFVEVAKHPENLKHRKKIRGILNGHVRQIVAPESSHIIVWRRQKNYEKLKDFYTVFPIPKTNKSLYLVLENKNIIHVNVPETTAILE